MSTDKIGMYLSKAGNKDSMGAEFSVIPMELRSPRHDYLTQSERYFTSRAFRNDRDEYMPDIRTNFINGCMDIKLEFCPAKLLYGHNLSEVGEQDFKAVLDKTIAALQYAGILVKADVLSRHILSRLDVNKLILLESPIFLAQRLLENTRTKGRFNKTISTYPNQGKSCANCLRHRKLIIYDKIAEVEQEQNIPAGLKPDIFKLRGRLLQVEYQMQLQRDIQAEFKRVGLSMDCTFENAFKSQVCQRILGYHLSQQLDGMLTIDNSTVSLLETAQNICYRYGIHGIQAVLAMTAVVWIINTFGINALCQYLKQFTDKKVVNKYINHISKLDFPRSNEEIEFRNIVMQTINQVEPIKLENFLIQVGDKYIPNLQGNTQTPTDSKEKHLWLNA